MFGMIKRSLSGGSDNKTTTDDESKQDTPVNKKPVAKRNLSDDAIKPSEKKTKLHRMNACETDIDTDAESEQDHSVAVDTQVKSTEEDQWLKNMPEDTPAWGQWILKVMRRDFQTLSLKVESAQTASSGATKSVRELNAKLNVIENVNNNLLEENKQLHDKVTELEFRQRRNNLIFEGVKYGSTDNTETAFSKLQSILHRIYGQSIEKSQIERCHWMTSKIQYNKKCLIACFGWYGDVQKILKNRKLLPKGVYVNEDLPEEWLDRRKILKPIYNTAKRDDSLKSITFFSKDKLIIKGKAYNAGPDSNLAEIGSVLDVTNTCQKSDSMKTIFQGIHSVFSNLHPAKFMVDKVNYNSVEQAIQATKAKIFDDTVTQRKVMAATNPYRIKKLGSKVRNYNKEQWSAVSKEIAFKSIKAKFEQNPVFKELLLSTGNSKIAEATKDPTWGIGVMLHDPDSMDETTWKQDGLMCELYSKIRDELNPT